MADSEARERSSILGKFRNMEHQVSGFNYAICVDTLYEPKIEYYIAVRGSEAAA